MHHVSMQQEENERCSHDHDTVSGNAEAGLMALWGLLNVSGYAPTQVSVGRPYPFF